MGAKTGLLALIVTLSVSCPVLAQEWQLAGRVTDSVSNSGIANASVALYAEGSEAIDHIQLTSQSGAFAFSIRNAKPAYRLVVSHIAYGERVIELSNDATEMRLGTIRLAPRPNTIEAVEVVPPVVVKGDTIEFNADAFQLDSNAVVEDLLYRLPGIVVWGDGAVTYNGRSLTKVFVNNEEFFGGDFKTALQNLPKNVVDKIQVYDGRTESAQREDPYNPRYEANIQLKEGVDRMLFGYLGYAHGNTERQDLSALVNYSVNKLQVSLGGVMNNTNKNLNSIEQLISNTTFKAGDISKDYNSDFFHPGIKDQRAYGGRLQYDLLDAPDNQVQHHVLFSGFVLDDQVVGTDSSNTVTFVDGQFQPIRQSGLSHDNEAKRRDIKAGYLYDNRNPHFYGFLRRLSADARYLNTDIQSSSTYNELAFFDHGPVFNSIGESRRNANREFRLVFGAEMRPRNRMNPSRFVTIESAGEFFLSKADDLARKSNPRLIINGDSLYNRDYDKSGQYASGKLRLTARNLERTVSGLNKWTANLSNSYEFVSNRENQVVSDSTVQGVFRHTGLSFREVYGQHHWNPKLDLMYSLWRRRIHLHSMQDIFFTLSPELDLFHLSNASDLPERNIRRHNWNFVPAMGLRYQFFLPRRSGAMGVRYKRNVVNPQLHQLSPLFDNISPVVIFQRNADLRSVGYHEYSIYHNLSILQRTHMDVRLAYRLNDNDFVESVSYTDAQRYVKWVNADTSTRSIQGRFGLQHPVKIGDSRNITFSYDGTVGFNRSMFYMEGEAIPFSSRNYNHTVSVYYMHFDRIKVGTDIILFSRTRKAYGASGGDIRRYWESNGSLKMAYYFTKSLTISSDFTRRQMDFGKFNDRFLIWNANIDYRLLKGNQLSLGASAFDLLNQNKGVVFRESFNEIASQYQNLLSQYFMLNITYYPRYFNR